MLVLFRHAIAQPQRGRDSIAQGASPGYRAEENSEAPTGRDSNVRRPPSWNLAPLGLPRFVDGSTQGSAALRPGLSNPAPLGNAVKDFNHQAEQRFTTTAVIWPVVAWRSVHLSVGNGQNPPNYQRKNRSRRCPLGLLRAGAGQNRIPETNCRAFRRFTDQA